MASSQGRLDEQRSSITVGNSKQNRRNKPQLSTIPDDDFFKKLLAN